MDDMSGSRQDDHARDLAISWPQILRNAAIGLVFVVGCLIWATTGTRQAEFFSPVGYVVGGFMILRSLWLWLSMVSAWRSWNRRAREREWSMEQERRRRDESG